ncbi:ABC1-domain-containing protein [Coccomyxa subellipsoidea C-169]|uniref:ABC1-domain-containing protein n=1 Tax=Coccomyxa subellipsoidea (strain C-169) TaxID=574566 RepID=I0Z9D4_COCSC|nr:ABC1-domain-containing protein [Coccomyxa subellipsoidea C-169]EIE27253.1 ABC1-domain-containing protein [Coccomyxa subellipsoidea C-169]|eukprot:XP_005651797.1 ABC1-domain-containing protein [Coccomyxa subellipsoidea C-169]
MVQIGGSAQRLCRTMLQCYSLDSLITMQSCKDDYSATWRTIAIWAFIIELRTRLFFIDQAWSYPGGMTPEKKSAAQRRLAAWTRENLLALGPTFIKLGQLFSTRSDLFPAEVTEELSLLQDRVPAFSPERAVSTIEQELGAPVTQLFRSFDRDPIAAASLGQVHRAVSHSGEQVVVKVQRPGLQRLFDIDLAQLRTVATQLDAGEDGRDFSGIYAECETILRQEIDYIAEGRNANRFRRNFRGLPWVKSPKIYWGLTTAKVLTMEYLPGIKISAAAALRSAGIDTALVARRATESYLMQVLRHSFLHSDPHPGNVMVDTDGSLIFVDFGMMSEISSGRRESLVELFYAVYRADADGVLAALIDLNIIVPTADALSLRRAIAFGLDNLMRKVDEKEAVAGIGEDLFAIALDQPFRFPASFTFVLRAFTTLEGFGRTLDPNYKFAAVAQPYALELLQLQDAQARQDFVLDQMQREAVKVGSAAMAMPGRVEKIDETLQQLRGGDLKLRVRALELERAARRSSILQGATMSAIAGGTLVNLGSQLIISGQSGVGGTLLAGSAVFGALVWRAFWRVKRIDRFEKNIRG